MEDWSPTSPAPAEELPSPSTPPWRKHYDSKHLIRRKRARLDQQHANAELQKKDAQVILNDEKADPQKGDEAYSPNAASVKHDQNEVTLKDEKADLENAAALKHDESSHGAETATKASKAEDMKDVVVPPWHLHPLRLQPKVKPKARTTCNENAVVEEDGNAASADAASMDAASADAASADTESAVDAEAAADEMMPRLRQEMKQLAELYGVSRRRLEEWLGLEKRGRGKGCKPWRHGQ